MLAGTVVIGLGVLQEFVPLFVLFDRPARLYRRLGFGRLSRREVRPPFDAGNLFTSNGFRLDPAGQACVQALAGRFRRTGEIVAPPVGLIRRPAPGIVHPEPNRMAC